MNIYHDKLNKISRNQIFSYPRKSIKQQLKDIIKSILKRKFKFKTDRYFWPNGLLAVSLEYSHRLTKNRQDIKQLRRYYHSWLKDGMKMNNADYAINGYSLIYLYEQTKRKKYAKAIERIADYVLSLKTTKDGSIPYRATNGGKVFVDLLGLTCPFLARYANFKKDTVAQELAIKQLVNYIEKGMDTHTGLPYHAYDANTGTKLGIVGWGRGVGWLLIGLVDSLEYISKKHKSYVKLKEELRKIVATVITYQNKKGGYNWQLTAREGHYDSSATAMISYALQKGIMLGLIPERYLKYVISDIDSLYNVTQGGKVYKTSGECRGLSMYPQVYQNYPWSQGPTTSLVALSLLDKH